MACRNYSIKCPMSSFEVPLWFWAVSLQMAIFSSVPTHRLISPLVSGDRCLPPWWWCLPGYHHLLKFSLKYAHSVEHLLDWVIPSAHRMNSFHRCRQLTFLNFTPTTATMLTLEVCK